MFYIYFYPSLANHLSHQGEEEDVFTSSFWAIAFILVHPTTMLLCRGGDSGEIKYLLGTVGVDLFGALPRGPSLDDGDKVVIFN